MYSKFRCSCSNGYKMCHALYICTENTEDYLEVLIYRGAVTFPIYIHGNKNSRQAASVVLTNPGDGFWSCKEDSVGATLDETPLV